MSINTEQVDKYGRAVARDHDNDDLKRFYQLEDAERPDYARGAVLLESSDEDEPDSDDGQYVALGTEPSNEEEEINLDENELADLDAQAAAYQREYAQNSTGPAEHTRRLAIVNLDWDNVKAVHLMKICSSVAATSSPSGRVLSVRIYPSEFGRGTNGRF